MATGLRLVLGLALFMSTFAVHAVERYRVGVHYDALPVPVETADPDRIEVVEVFSYACIHCRDFEPYIERWETNLAGDVQFRRMPAVFSNSWKAVAAPFYVAQRLGVLDEIHEPMFRAIHDERINMTRPDRIAALFKAHANIDEQKTLAELKSFDVDKALRQAQGLALTGYGVDGVPTMIVNGRYRVSAEKSGKDQAMLDVVNFLVGKERERLGSAEAGQ